MMNTEYFDLLYRHLEERTVDNVFTQLNSDIEYQQALEEENKLYEQYEAMSLSKEERRIIERWTNAITERNGAYSSVLFRMGMQTCFSLLVELAGLR